MENIKRKDKIFSLYTEKENPKLSLLREIDYLIHSASEIIEATNNQIDFASTVRKMGKQLEEYNTMQIRYKNNFLLLF